MEGQYAIEMRGICKSFGSVAANKDVNLNVRPGEILALLNIHRPVVEKTRPLLEIRDLTIKSDEGAVAIHKVNFANWNPVLAILGTLVFGFFNTLQIYAGSLAGAFPGPLGWLNTIPPQLYKALPFLITAIVLIASSIRGKEGSGQPAALGLNYFREDR